MRLSTKLSIVCVFLLGFISFVNSSYCGQAAIPFSLEVLQNGRPVLGCARPSCFGWTATGARSADPAQFYRIEKRADGFFRSTDLKGPIIKNATGFQPQYSICDRSYLSSHCSGASWVGGIAPSVKVDSSESLKLMCCYYNKLSDAAEQGSEEVRAGGIVEGGEIRNEFGRTNSFEYIANIQRLFDKNGEVIYIATMKKFTCVPEPPASFTVGVDSEAKNFLIDNILQSSITSIPRKSFAEQKFELPETMNHEDNIPPASKPTIHSIDQNMEKPTATIGENSMQHFKPSNSRIPIAKSMDEEEKDNFEDNKNSNTLEESRPRSRYFAVSTLDNSIIKPQQNNHKAHSQQQTITNNQQYHSQYQQQQPTQNTYHNQQLQNQQQQQQPQQLQQQPQRSPMDPFGLFSSSQWLIPQQQPSYYSYYANNGAIQSEQNQPHQQQYYYSTERRQPQINGVSPNNAQQIAQQKNSNAAVGISSSTTLRNDGIMQPLPGFGAMPFTLPPMLTQPPSQLLSAGRVAPAANIVDSAFNLPEQPSIQIPTPEEIENAIPATSRRLIANLARTFLGYFN